LVLVEYKYLEIIMELKEDLADLVVRYLFL
jgi:hypothetical protein